MVNTVQVTTNGLDKLLGLTRQDLEAFAALGFQLQQQGKVSQAEAIFRGLVVLDSELYFGYAGLGAIALDRDPPDMTAAQENLSRAADLNPNDPAVQAQLGEVLLRLARFEDAAKAFDLALRLDPDHANLGATRARAILDGIDLIASEVQRIVASKCG